MHLFFSVLTISFHSHFIVKGNRDPEIQGGEIAPPVSLAGRDSIQNRVYLTLCYDHVGLE
jgi:hypothetical protein